jgi:DNA primase catalytic subunit
MDSADPMVVMSYYRHLLPFRQLFTWLNRASGSAPSRNFTHREFAFTLQNEAYLRYNSFGTWEELRKEVLRLNPARFEIGPVYTAKVRRSTACWRGGEEARSAHAVACSPKTARRCKRRRSSPCRASLCSTLT